MAEQRQQEDRHRIADDAPAAPDAAGGINQMLLQAFTMLQEARVAAPSSSSATAAAIAPTACQIPDFAKMTEEELMAYAVQLSLQDNENNTPVDYDDVDYSSVMKDAAFLESVLTKLPGVDVNSDVVRQAINFYTGAEASAAADPASAGETSDEDGNPSGRKRRRLE